MSLFKRTLLSLSLLSLTTIAFADTQPWKPLEPANVQHPIAFFNSTKHWVNFVIVDDQGHRFEHNKAPIPMWPTIELTKIQPMWHHNITVMAEFHDWYHKPMGMACSPTNAPEFGGRYSYVQGYTFVAAEQNGQPVCNAVKL